MAQLVFEDEAVRTPTPPAGRFVFEDGPTGGMEDVSRQAGGVTPETIVSASRAASVEPSRIPLAIAQVLRERVNAVVTPQKRLELAGLGRAAGRVAGEWFVDPLRQAGLLPLSEEQAMALETGKMWPAVTEEEKTQAMMPAALLLAMFGTAASPGVRMASQYRSAPFGRAIQPTEILGPELAVRTPPTASEPAFAPGLVTMPRQPAVPRLLSEAMGKPNVPVRAAEVSLPPPIRAAMDPREVPSGGIDPAPIFYSQLARIIDQKMPNRAAPEQVSAIVRKGDVKEDEIKWTGLDEWLKEQKGPISKQDVVDFLRQNQVEVREVPRGVDSVLNPQETMRYSQLLAKRDRGLLSEADDAELQKLFGLFDQRFPTKFSTWQLPGGESYRELLLTLPYEKPFRDYGAFRSTHWDEPNVLAHVRFNERTDAQGKKVLFIEEIQSDWHQAGRKVGYKIGQPNRQENYATWGERHGLTPAEVEATWQSNDPRYLRWQFEQDLAFRDASDESRRVSPAPFAKTWHELVLKRMLRWAAEYGFDKVAWISGEETAKRYDLSKQVDSLGWAAFRDGTFSLYAEKGNDLVGSFLRIKAGELDQYVGKDAAEKIKSFQGQSTRFTPETRIQDAYRQGELSGLDLKVGGEWAKHLYDEMLPQFLNKYGKKWGARVAETTIPNIPLKEASSLGEAATIAKSPEQIQVWSLDISPEMKHSVMFQGQPLFALIPPLIASAAMASQRRGERDRQSAGVNP